MRFTAPPIVAGSGRISKMVMFGSGKVEGANFVSAKAVVNPAMPPPRMITLSGEDESEPPFVGVVTAL